MSLSKDKDRTVEPGVDTGEASHESTQLTLSARQKKEKARKAKALMRDVLESTQEVLKKRPGGWRAGAGRKPNYLKRSKLPPLLAHEILSHFDLPKLWGSLLNSKDESIRLQALIYLTNREQGMPKQIGEFRSEALANTSIRVEFVRPVLVNGQPIDPENASAGEQAEASTPALLPPASDRFVVPPQVPLPTAECRFHGVFSISAIGANEPCPRCKTDAEEQERKLQAMIPGGFGRQ